MATSESPEREARRALNRMRRALEKTVREMEALQGAIRSAEGSDFPAAEYEEARAHVERVMGFLDEEERRLREKVLASGGLEPGRVRRASTLE
jgi:hypothetical protein